jgi:hypothetical protein
VAESIADHQILLIHRLRQQGLSMNAIAKQAGVAKATVQKVITDDVQPQSKPGRQVYPVDPLPDDAALIHAEFAEFYSKIVDGSKTTDLAFLRRVHEIAVEVYKAGYRPWYSPLSLIMQLSASWTDTDDDDVYAEIIQAYSDLKFFRMCRGEISLDAYRRHIDESGASLADKKLVSEWVAATKERRG